jgi:hypothetical protein
MNRLGQVRWADVLAHDQVGKRAGLPEHAMAALISRAQPALYEVLQERNMRILYNSALLSLTIAVLPQVAIGGEPRTRATLRFSSRLLSKNRAACVLSR